MKKLKLTLPLMISTILIAGCGGDSQPGNSAAYQSSSNLCSQQFINDYHGVAAKMIAATNKQELQNALDALNSFGSQYQGVVCDAQNLKTSQRESVNVDNRVREMRDALLAAIAKLS